jgi:hypothetical protein
MSANGLLGRRVDPIRAGIRTNGENDDSEDMTKQGP